MLTKLTGLLRLRPMTTPNRYFIISSLFKKRRQAQQEQKVPYPSQQDKDNQKEKEPDDQMINFFERRKEMDTSFDFIRLKEMTSDNIPQDLGKGGLEEVIYWSQSAVTPQQVTQILLAFNKTADQKPEQLDNIHQHQVQLESFNHKVSSFLYVISSLSMLREYAVYAYKFDLEEDQFWDKVEFKAQKFFPSTQEEYGWLIDIGFLMGQMRKGVNIYNHVAKFLQNQDLTIDQYTKLYLTYYMLKIGQKPWIDKLLKGIASNIHEADEEQLTSLLSALREVKSLPQEMNTNIEKRALELVDRLSLKQVTALMNYFGFEHKEENTWRILQQRLKMQLSKIKIDADLLSLLILRVLPTYQVSTPFVRQYIVKPIEQSKLAVLQLFPISTLSTLSKGLYIYELQNETKHIEIELSRLVISKMTKDISKLTDSEILRVIQDYNLTRNGSRQLYIFLEEVVRVRYLRGFDAQTDMHTVQMLIEIYGNSGMCSREMYENLQSLILE